MTANLNNTAQEQLNQTYQEANQSCVASCSNVQSGNTVFLDGSSTGDITFDQTCTADASCTISTTLENLVAQLQASEQGNETTANLFGGINHMALNSNVLNQSTTNQVKQIMNTICSADVDNLQSNNLIYARNSTTGNIAFTQNGNAQADCIMTNLAIAKADQTQRATQNNSVTAGGTAFFIVIAIIVIALALVASRKKNPEQGQDQNAQTKPASGVNFSSLVGSRTGGGRTASRK